MAGKFWLEYTSNQNIIVDEKPERLSDRLQQLGIDQSFFFSLVDKFFYSQYPQKKGKILGDQTQEDQLWQWRWYSIADKLADKGREEWSAGSRVGPGYSGRAIFLMGKN